MSSTILEFKRVCPRCGKEFIVKGTQSEFNRGKLKRFCSRACANTRDHSEETKAKIKTSLKHYNKTHIKVLDESTLKKYHCKYCNNIFTYYTKRDVSGNNYCSKACKENWKKEFANLGGYREGSGRGKSGWYKGIYCSSTWELAYLIYHLDHNLRIERCKEKRSYIFEGKIHNYYPDFVTDNGIIEIKGYSTEQWQAKQEQNPDVITLYKNDMKPYLQYVHDNYTNDIVSLYDNEKPKKSIGKFYAWVHNDIQNAFIKSNELEKYLNNGWIKGRKNFKN